MNFQCSDSEGMEKMGEKIEWSNETKSYEYMGIGWNLERYIDMYEAINAYMYSDEVAEWIEWSLHWRKL